MNSTKKSSSHPQSDSITEMGLSFPNPISFRAGHHRRAHSEVNFRIPDELDMGFDGGPSAAGFDEDDLFCTYMDIEKLGSRPDLHGLGSSAPKSDNAGDEEEEEEEEEEQRLRTRHRHSNSMDGSSLMDSIDAKKAMAPDKLAELWTVDPKRAKRSLSLSNIGFQGNIELLFSIIKILFFLQCQYWVGIFSILQW